MHGASQIDMEEDKELSRGIFIVHHRQITEHVCVKSNHGVGRNEETNEERGRKTLGRLVLVCNDQRGARSSRLSPGLGTRNSPASNLGSDADFLCDFG